MSQQDKDPAENTKPPKPGQPADDWQEQEDFLEEALEETFPGSDPISPGHPQKSKT